MNIAITTTTISPITNFLKEYTDNINLYDHTRDVCIYIAGDCKSSTDSNEIASKYTRQGYNIKFLDIYWQREYLKRFPDLEKRIPENSDNRRNVAYLLALEEGADVIISVDDDNFPLPDVDFVGTHLKVGTEVQSRTALGQGGWFNLCSLLTPVIADSRLYPRGFPYNRRTLETNNICGNSSGKVGVNVGLWIADPDTDAISRLYANPVIVGRKDDEDVMLGRDTFCPINTQNTALSREAMAAYYYVRMGETLRGMRLDRFGDIFSGYFVQLCAKAVGDRIIIGSPIAEHRRNKHNLFVDLYNELAGIMIIDDLATFFESVKLPGGSYKKAYQALSFELEKYVCNEALGFIWEPETRDYFRNVSSNMRVWADIVDDLG